MAAAPSPPELLHLKHHVIMWLWCIHWPADKLQLVGFIIPSYLSGGCGLFPWRRQTLVYNQTQLISSEWFSSAAAQSQPDKQTFKYTVRKLHLEYFCTTTRGQQSVRCLWLTNNQTGCHLATCCCFSCQDSTTKSCCSLPRLSCVQLVTSYQTIRRRKASHLLYVQEISQWRCWVLQSEDWMSSIGSNSSCLISPMSYFIKM